MSPPRERPGCRATALSRLTLPRGQNLKIQCHIRHDFGNAGIERSTAFATSPIWLVRCVRAGNSIRSGQADPGQTKARSRPCSCKMLRICVCPARTRCARIPQTCVGESVRKSDFSSILVTAIQRGLTWDGAGSASFV